MLGISIFSDLMSDIFIQFV